MDPQAEIEELKARVERLERMAGLDPLPKAPQPTPAETPAPPTETPPAPLPYDPIPAPPPLPVSPQPGLPTTPPAPVTPPAATPPSAGLATSEAWLARIGIGLLLIGFLFFLKLSLDRGWITPVLQLAAGAAACVFLLIWGDRVSRERPSIGNLAFGGGIAGLIGVLAAGQHIYHLYGGIVTCVLSLVVGLLCFAQALRRDSSVLCVLALIGTSISPFFLGLHDITFFAVDALAAGALALATYFFRGWRNVLWTGAVTCWLLLFSAATASWFSVVIGGREITQAAILLAWLGFWLVPAARYLRQNSSPEASSIWLTAFMPGLAAMLATGFLWGEGSRGAIGGGLLVLMALSLALGGVIRQHKTLASAQLAGAAVFGGLAIPVLLEGLSCWIILAAYALALHFAARSTGERPLRILAYTATVVCYGAFLVLAVYLATSWERNWSLTFSCVALLLSVGGAACLTPNPKASGALKILTYLGGIALILAELASGHLAAPLGVFLCALIALAGWLGAFGGASNGQRILAHILFTGLVPWVLFQLLDGNAEIPWLNPTALSTCGVLGCALAVALLTPSPRVRLSYLWMLYGFGLVLLWTQFRDVGNGAGVSVSWAISAVVLITVGVIRNSRPLRLAGMATLILLLIRLFVFDLAQLDLAAKTLIFLGIGLFLFAAGYFLPKFLPQAINKAP